MYIVAVVAFLINLIIKNKDPTRKISYKYQGLSKHISGLPVNIICYKKLIEGDC